MFHLTSQDRNVLARMEGQLTFFCSLVRFKETLRRYSSSAADAERQHLTFYLHWHGFMGVWGRRWGPDRFSLNVNWCLLFHERMKQAFTLCMPQRSC